MADPENSEGKTGKLASDLDLFIILRIGHFTVLDGSEDDGDLVLIQTFLLYYVNQVILMLTSISESRTISITKQRMFVSKQDHRQPHIHSKARVLCPRL